MSTFITVEAAIHPKEAKFGRPEKKSAGTTSTAPSTIWAVITCAGLRLALTAAFQPACRTALSSARETSVRSIAQAGGDATMTTQ